VAPETRHRHLCYFLHLLFFACCVYQAGVLLCHFHFDRAMRSLLFCNSCRQLAWREEDILHGVAFYHSRAQDRVADGRDWKPKVSVSLRGARDQVERKGPCSGFLGGACRRSRIEKGKEGRRLAFVLVELSLSLSKKIDPYVEV
jgi:hypothetical protein